jgi:Domain of unknown function (DUF4157)
MDRTVQRRALEGADGHAAAGASSVPGKSTLTEVAQRAADPVPYKAQMESSFGASFGGVNAVMGGPAASAALDSHNANAATIGNTIVFGESSPSAALVGHELAHTIQQGAVSAPMGSGGGGGAEAEASAAGARAASGQSASVGTRAPAGVPQFDLRGTVDQNRQKRDVDSGAGDTGPVAGQHASFSDMGDEDKGPGFHHDHGFLDDGKGGIDKSKMRSATLGDYAALAKWTAMLEAAEVLRPDLVDGTAAYRHFLTGGGATRDCHYPRYIAGDSSGRRLLESAKEDLHDAAVLRSDQDLVGKAPAPGSQSFHIRTGIIGVGNDRRYPYPGTENWQKAIGAHQIWIEANVTVQIVQLQSQPPPPAGVPEGGSESIPTYQRLFHLDMTIHMEDMYNFNPGMHDIATGAADAANGRFELTGLGHEYLNTGTYAQGFDFFTTMEPLQSTPGSGGGTMDPGRSPREGRPGDRRPYPTTR